jgi:hypothetical protein
LHVALQVCSGCKLVSYCSKLCQKEDWKKGHKESCCKPQAPENSLIEGAQKKADEQFKDTKKIENFDIKECANCGIQAKSLSMCSRCKITSYCCQACQLQHWGAVGGHKKFCAPLDQRLPGSAVRCDSNEGVKCAICQESLSTRSSSALPCSHMFHSDCVSELRQSDTSQTCPVCRSSIIEEKEAELLFQDALKCYHTLISQVGRDKATLDLFTIAQGQEMSEIYQAFLKAASLGHAEAKFYLGVIHKFGHGVKQSDTEAFYWCEKAAKQGDAVAQNKVGGMYLIGRGVKQSDTEAFRWYEKAAQQGYASAQYFLGVMYRDGLGIKRSVTESFCWFDKAAKQGNASAALEIISMRHEGRL